MTRKMKSLTIITVLTNGGHLAYSVPCKKEDAEKTIEKHTLERLEDLGEAKIARIVPIYGKDTLVDPRMALLKY